MRMQFCMLERHRIDDEVLKTLNVSVQGCDLSQLQGQEVR